MDVTWQMLLMVCPLVFLAGFVDAVAGGGGLISLPAYYLAGLPPVLAAGTNKLSACLGTITSSVQYALKGKVLWRIGLLAAAGAFPGSWLGTAFLQMIPENTVRIIMVIVIPLFALLVWHRDASKVRTRPAPRHISLLALGTGLVIGFYDGLIGPGTGTLLILMFTLALGMETVNASGTAKIVNLASNLAALVSLIAAGKVLWLLGLPAAAAGMAGNLLGARMTIRSGGGFIRIMMTVVLCLLLAKMLLDVV